MRLEQDAKGENRGNASGNQDGAPVRNAPSWSNGSRNSTFAQNDDYASRQGDDDRGPPVTYRGRHRPSWDSYRGRDQGGPRWDRSGDDDDQGDDDGPGYGPPERDDGFRGGGWY
jgi:hypothetical protein